MASAEADSPRRNTKSRRSRSRSPSTRRDRSRSRSRENARRRNRSASRSSSFDRKKKKKEKKHKKVKRRQTSDNADVSQEESASTDALNATPSTLAVKTDRKRDFFAQLKEQEASKGTIGTIHSSGRKQESATVLTDNWECVKAGCGNSNMKRATSCLKCGAMRRISQWR
ncbi:hypothetical protein H310_00452 [Aphanomyces invadans]|uniref:RanBP2-type domain-containing protein n=1 Tax=Aphanomyces invadans TaxID=157072 RepID=A0A024UU66_9STRA|nr:hypothetical protein H310_00452 [Aphanomyces invadans]ETW10066.1 hypothetical protein H310_00452 [Aphanomyces invadans]|eukprot:XP_008861477.1 hypothetical protein H310_00452 [Aphanomyces invadans]